MDSASAVALLGLAEEISPGLTGPDAGDSLERLDAWSDDMVAATAWFVEAGRTDEALRLANALYRLWILKRRFEDGDRCFTRVLESGAGDDRLRARAFLNAGFMPFWMGDDDRAGSLFRQALELARGLDDASLMSQVLGGLSRVALRTDVPEGRRLAREALEASESAADEAGRSNALHLLGVGAQIAGDLPEARQWMTERLALVRSLRNDFLVASEASNLSMVERQLANLDVAEELGSRGAHRRRTHRRRVHETLRDLWARRDRHRARRLRAGRNAAGSGRGDDGGPEHGVATGRAAALRADAGGPPAGDGGGRIRTRPVSGSVDVPIRCGRHGPRRRTSSNVVMHTEGAPMSDRVFARQFHAAEGAEAWRVLPEGA